MKRTSILVLLLAVHSAHSFVKHGPPRPPPPSSSDSSDSSMSSEEDSFERGVVQKKRVQPEEFMKMQQTQTQPKKQPPPPPAVIEEKKNKFFDRPSSDELEAYEEKVQRQNKNKKPKDFPTVIEEQPVMMQGSMDSDIIRPKPRKGDEFDEKTFLATLGQIYVEKMDQESREREMGSFPGPIGPMGPPGPPADFDYIFFPYDYETPKQANNNGNNNVHVNVNHVQVNSNVIHAPSKEEKDKKDRTHDEIPPPAYMPVYHEPVSTSKYLYLNLNMTDAVIFAVLLAGFVFATKKAYQRCFPKKQVAPQLPTTLPPTYSPSHIVVETTSKKVPQ